MLVRLYELNVGIEASVQPDAGTPTLANDLITKGYADANFTSNNEIQDVPTGLIDSSNTIYTLAQTPTSNASVKVYLNGIFQRQGTDYTISGVTLTFTTAPATSSVLDAVYTY
jgi:hypothetical protein